MKNHIKGLLSITISAFCFAVLATLGILLFKGGANPETILTGRFAIATLLFFLTIILKDTKLFWIEKMDIKWFLLLGLILFVQIITYWYGLQIIKTVSIQVGLFFTYPIWLAILTPLILREKLNKLILFSIGYGLMGVLLVLGIIPNGVSYAPFVGVLLALATAVIWAMYYAGSQLLSRRYHLLTILFYNFLFNFVAFSFLQPISVTLSQVTLSVFWYILALAFVSTYLAYGFLQYAIKLNGVVVVGIHNMIQPVFAIIIAFLVLNQTMTFYQAIGSAIIISNIYLLNRWRVN